MDRIVISVFGAPVYLTTAFPDGSTPADHFARRLAELSGIDGFEHPPIAIGGELSADERAVVETVPGFSEWDTHFEFDGEAASIYRHLHAVLERGVEQLLVLRLDAPFFDSQRARDLVDLHRRSWCDYTFADGYPTGFTVEVVRRDVLPVLGDLAEAGRLRWKPGILFETLSRDINAFDIETEAAPEDYAAIRASFTVDSRQNYVLCRRLVQYTDAPAEMPQLLLTHPVIRRTRPYYYQVQITTAMVQRPMYTPWADSRWAPAGSLTDDGRQQEHIMLERWNTILGKIAAETPEATIAIGYRGDPACHPELPDLIRSAEEYSGVNLYVETAGIAWSEAAIQALSSPAVAAVIVELDTNVPETYETLRGPLREEAVAFVERLAETMPGRVYAQATRMQENEWELQEFYQTWNAKEGVTVIIQKHNSFAGKITDRRVADLSPLERPACRHLERDMVIRMDGEVPRCFQDLDVELSRGSLLKDSVATIWERGESEFEEHTRGVYSQMCRVCDEYYTFNA